MTSGFDITVFGGGAPGGALRRRARQERLQAALVEREPATIA